MNLSYVLCHNKSRLSLNGLGFRPLAFAGCIKRHYHKVSKNCSGQMTVELAVCLPVILAVLAIAVNALSYLEACARFDRVAAEAVRIEAASPGYAAYGTELRAQRVNTTIAAAFTDYNNLSFKVTAAEAKDSEGQRDPAALLPYKTTANVFSMFARLETYQCTLLYQPLGFGCSFFGVQFFALTHTSAYTIDPFRPGVIV